MKSTTYSKLFLISILLFSLQMIVTNSYAQVIELESTKNGFLAPRMTTAERDNITNLANGLIIYNTTTDRINYYDGTHSEWLELYPNSVLEYFITLPNGPQVLISAGETIPNMLTAGATVEALFSGGATIEQLSDAGVTLAQMLTGGLTIQALISGGITIQELIDADVTLQELLTAQVTPADILSGSTFAANEFIGLNYGGGLIFYLANNGSGYVSSSMDLGQFQWGCADKFIDGADGTAIGTGAQNTMDIVNDCSNDNIAAKECSDLSLNNFDDWFLPSIFELLEMYNAIGPGASGINQNIGSFTSEIYLSSSEHALTLAKTIDFSNAGQSQFSKSFAGFYVRPIRTF